MTGQFSRAPLMRRESERRGQTESTRPNGPAGPQPSRPSGAPGPSAAERMSASTQKRATDPMDGGTVMRKCSSCAGGGASTCSTCAHSPAPAPGMVMRKCSSCASQKPMPPGIVMRACDKCAAEKRLGGAAPEPGEADQCDECAAAGPGRIARAADGHAVEEAPPAFGSTLGTRRGMGAPLAPEVREFFEPRFGADLAGVRVHTEMTDAELAESIGARAFTYGNDIFFARGEYQPDSADGRRLLAHELAHTFQQPPNVPHVQTMAMTSPGDSLESDADRVADAVMAGRFTAPSSLQASAPTVMSQPAEAPPAPAGITGGNVFAGASASATGTASVGASLGSLATSAVNDPLGTAYNVLSGAANTVVEGAEVVYDTAAEGARWLATEAGSLALRAANELIGLVGGTVTVGPNGLVIDIPNLRLCGIHPIPIPLPTLSHYIPIIAGGFAAGPAVVNASLGLKFSYTPTLTAVLGPCVASARIEIDPLGGHYRARGSLSVGAAITQLNVIRAGVRGEGSLTVIVPIAGVPVPLKLMSVGVDLGGWASLRLSGGGTLGTMLEVDYTAGRLRLSAEPSLALGAAIDLDAGLFAGLDMNGVKLCDFIWPAWHWGRDIAHQWSIPMSVSYGGGGTTTFGAIVSNPVPFEEAVQGIDRTPPTTKCPLVDQLCVVMRSLGLLPHQKGVGWKGHPAPNPPTPCNTHPDAPYLEDPHIASGAKCRGVCGPDCAKSCVPMDPMTRCNESGGQHTICEYNGIQQCGTHDGCRHHDACYDWCAAGGSTSILDSCHRWCDAGCACNYDMNTCVGWALGNGPFDGVMTFYDESRSPTYGPYPGPCPPAELIARVDAIIAIGDPERIVEALALMPLTDRQVINSYPALVARLERAIGPGLWPTAQRILAGQPSAAVPSLDEATWFLVDLAIRRTDHPRALDLLLRSLIARGIVNTTLATWAYVPRTDQGEGLTTWTYMTGADGERRSEGPARVEIYTPAFLNVGWLFSIVMHENTHVNQAHHGYDPATEMRPGGNRRLPEVAARDEVDAYLWQIEHALGSGLLGDVGLMRELGDRLRHHYNLMTDLMREQYLARYEAAQRRVRDVIAGVPQMSIDDARRILNETAIEIQDELRNRPLDPVGTDARIAAIRARRSQALIAVALVDNPATQIVEPGEPGVYRVPTVDQNGRVQYVHGGIQVAWHLAPVTPSAYGLGATLSAGGEMAVAGTAVQGRVHPFPPDVDFDERIHVTADTLEEAGNAAAARIVANIRRVSGGPVPGSSDVEFRHLLTFPRGGGRGIRMGLGDVNGGGAVAVLGRAIAQLNGGNINSFWRGYIVDDPA